jgi:hypothetical protein
MVIIKDEELVSVMLAFEDFIGRETYDNKYIERNHKIINKILEDRIYPRFEEWIDEE